VRLDVHAHLAAEPPHGELSQRFRKSLVFRYLRRTEARGPDPAAALKARLVEAAATLRVLDGVVVLALDRPHSEVGLPLAPDLFVPNQTVAALCRESPRLRLGASVHPYRADALEALDEAVALGAVLLKWLPNAQRIDPASPRCRAFYRRLKELGLPLLSHTGDEHTLPAPAQNFGDIRRLVPALEAGVTVMAGHAGTGGAAKPPEIVALVEQHPRLFLECSALWTPHRFTAMQALLAVPSVREQWVYGSDWPVPIFWPWTWRHSSAALRAARSIANPFDRRAAAALALGVPEAAFTRSASLCRL
jgi:predicted TIM-barrel fold metal-dependent hydrolase